MRRQVARKRGAKHTPMYDSKGLFRETGKDLCDCLDESCVGCFFPCESCGASKCGTHCRVNREWRIDEISSDGRQPDFVIVDTKKPKDHNNNN